MAADTQYNKKTKLLSIIIVYGISDWINYTVQLVKAKLNQVKVKKNKKNHFSKRQTFLFNLILIIRCFLTNVFGFSFFLCVYRFRFFSFKIIHFQFRESERNLTVKRDNSATKPLLNQNKYSIYFSEEKSSKIFFFFIR